MSTSQTRPGRPAHHQPLSTHSTHSTHSTDSSGSTSSVSTDTTHDTTQDTTSAITDKIRQPIIIGGVTITGPNTKGYYRLKWHEPDGTLGDTSGSRDEAHARLKAHDINARLTQAAGPKATTPLTLVVEAFLAEEKSPYKEKLTYKQAQLDGLRRKLTRGLRGLEHVRAMDLDRRLCDLIRSQAGTHNGVVENTNALRALLHWGYQDGYFTAAQVELLPRSSATPQPAHKTTRILVSGARRGQRPRQVGQAGTYIEDEDCPNDKQIKALAKELEKHFPLWGTLGCELAANTGMRWGEQFQLPATDAHLDGCRRFHSPHIHVNWQIASTRKAGKDGTGDRRDLPKGRKTRVVPIPKRSITGYKLRKALRARVAAAQAEQLAGTNPEALLFPADRGGMLWHSSFNSDHLLPAMISAGLPVETYRVTSHQWDAQRRAYVETVHTERHAIFCWHSLRHRWARICVDIRKLQDGELMALGGWDNIATVRNRYYESGDDNANSGLAKFD
jgi:integrase